MPLAFPSHQGLILPLWRRWPHRFDAVALCVGAATPDIVDALVFGWRRLLGAHGSGEVDLGQGIGHSLVGVVVLSVPIGLALTFLARRLTPQRWLDRLASPLTKSRGEAWTRTTTSIGVGALSHVLFDFVTHANFVLLLPWYESDEFFPSWWRRAWFEIPLFVYRKPYPIGVHFVAWTIMSVVGVWLFVRCVRRSHAQR
jgi:hypothetical protein